MSGSKPIDDSNPIRFSGHSMASSMAALQKIIPKSLESTFFDRILTKGSEGKKPEGLASREVAVIPRPKVSVSTDVKPFDIAVAISQESQKTLKKRNVKPIDKKLNIQVKVMQQPVERRVDSQFNQAVQNTLDTQQPAGSLKKIHK